MILLDETKLERRSLARNELLFRQGDKVHAIYFIEEGRLRLDRRTFDGRALVFGTSCAGEFFVEAALFAEIFHCDAAFARARLSQSCCFASAQHRPVERCPVPQTHGPSGD